MPNYDYRCNACGHALELFQSMSAAPKKKCPACGKSALVRLIGAGAGFLFKCKGFYLTDYRSKGYQEAASKEQGDTPAATGEKKAEAKAPAAPATTEPSTASAKKAKKKADSDP